MLLALLLAATLTLADMEAATAHSEAVWKQLQALEAAGKVREVSWKRQLANGYEAEYKAEFAGDRLLYVSWDHLQRTGACWLDPQGIIAAATETDTDAPGGMTSTTYHLDGSRLILAISQIPCGSSFPEDRTEEGQLSSLDRLKPTVAEALGHR